MMIVIFLIVPKNMSVKEKERGCIFYFYYYWVCLFVTDRSLEIVTSWHLVLCCFKFFCAKGLIYIILFIWCSTFANVVYCKFIFNLSGGFFVFVLGKHVGFFNACKAGFSWTEVKNPKGRELSSILRT